MPWASSTRGGSTRRSRTERLLVLQRWPVCYLAYPGCTIASTEDEHVIPKHQGGTDHLSNRRGACRHCHTIKTQAEAKAARPSTRRPPEQHPGLLT